MFGWINPFDSKYFSGVHHVCLILHVLNIRYETVDINVAIATDAGVLVTPLVYNADQKVDSHGDVKIQLRWRCFFLFRVFPL